MSEPISRHIDPPKRIDSRLTRWSADLTHVRCSACGEMKPLDQYRSIPYKDERRPNAWCIPCARRLQNERVKYRRETEPGFREHMNEVRSAWNAKYRAGHADEIERQRAERQAARAQQDAERRLLTDWAIAALRADGVSLSEIARQFDVELSAVSRWASGHTMPRPHHLDRLIDLAFDHGAVWNDDEEAA